MGRSDERVTVDVEFDDRLLDEVDRYRRRSGHEDRSAVVSAAIDRLAEDR